MFKYKIKDEWEAAIVEIHDLSIENSGFSKIVNFQIVKEYSNSYGLEHLEIFRIIKKIVNRLEQ